MTNAKIGRREFLAGLGGVGVGFGLGGVSHWLPLAPPQVGPDWSPGAEELIASTCMLCPARCGIRGRVVDGNLVRIDGNPLHPVSRGALCPKGAAGLQLLYHPGRLTGPVERVGAPGSADFRRISWEEALAKVAKALGGLRGDGRADAVGWVVGDVPGVMGELLRRFAGTYGTPHLIEETYADGASEVMKLCQGIDAQPAFDLGSSDMVLSFGAPLSEAWWSPPQASWAREGAQGPRPHWVQFDVRLSRTAAVADEWVPVKPGTYGTLALGIAYILLKEGLYDVERLHEAVAGVHDFEDARGGLVPGFRSLVLRHGRTEAVSERTGVPAETLVRVAKMFGSKARAVALWDHAVSWRAGGLTDALAIHSLNLLTGALGRPGGVLVQSPPPVPRLDAPSAKAAAREGKPPLTTEDWFERVAGGSQPGIEALFLYYSNPAASARNTANVRKALERVPLVVSFSPFLDESAKYAHLVLPDHTYLERWQDAPAPPAVPIPVWNLVQPVASPLHETKATGDVILSLAAEIGGDLAAAFPWKSVEEVVRERSRSLAQAPSGGLFDKRLAREELRELEARGWWIPHGMSEGEFWETLRRRGGWFDPFYDYHDRSAISQLPGGKAWIFPPEARERIASTTSDLEEGFLPVPKEGRRAGEPREFPLRLVPFRVMTLASGGTALMPWLLENLGVLTGDAWETWAEIHPETAREHGLAPGQMVRVESLEGGFTARLRIFQGAQPGVVNVPYGLHTNVEGWGRMQGSNPLAAVGARRDPSTGLPDWYSTRVRVVPA